mgnify:CR=1 FL=1
MKKLVLFCLIMISHSALSTEKSNRNELKWQMNAGINLYQFRHHEYINDPIPSYADVEVGMVFGFGVQQVNSSGQSWGTKLELQDMEGYLLTSFRAIDYRFDISESWQLGAHIGAAHYDFRTAAFGYTAGLGLFYQPDTWNNWGLSVEAQYFDKIARDKLHPDDPNDPNSGPDSFIDIQNITLSITYSF